MQQLKELDEQDLSFMVDDEHKKYLKVLSKIEASKVT